MVVFLVKVHPFESITVKLYEPPVKPVTWICWGSLGTLSDQLNNQITIETSRNNTSLQGQEIIIDLVIVYDIMCLSWHKLE